MASKIPNPDIIDVVELEPGVFGVKPDRIPASLKNLDPKVLAAAGAVAVTAVAGAAAYKHFKGRNEIPEVNQDTPEAPQKPQGRGR